MTWEMLRFYHVLTRSKQCLSEYLGFTGIVLVEIGWIFIVTIDGEWVFLIIQ